MGVAEAGDATTVGRSKPGTGGICTRRSGDLILIIFAAEALPPACVVIGDTDRALEVGRPSKPADAEGLALTTCPASLTEAGDERIASRSPWLSTLMAEGGRSTARRLARSSSSSRKWCQLSSIRFLKQGPTLRFGVDVSFESGKSVCTAASQ